MGFLPLMAPSARILHLPYLHSPHSLLKISHAHFQFHFSRKARLHSPCWLSLSATAHHSSFSRFPLDSSFISLPILSGSPHFSLSGDFVDRVFFGGKDGSAFRWNYAPGGTIDGAAFGEEKKRPPEVAVVVLGWLGAKPKHLRRYVELYNARGIHAVTFVASVMDVLWVDLGKGLEERISRLAQELAAWLSGERGRERVLMFHTFSNTGWLAYGAILDNLKERRDLLDKIKGCVVDSGGDPNIDPKVWAAGFTTALLKKSSSATYPSGKTGDESKIEEKEPFFVEALLLSGFEKLFSYLLNLPYVNQKLTKIISCLWNDQPPCPQLYLYSTGDRVIPYGAVETFMEEQRKGGKTVFRFNFRQSPHVDHYRTFPSVYASQLDIFLKECLSSVGKL